ncbi:hemopexin repeat-containing protein [Dapis sp. BLCC M126]
MLTNIPNYADLFGNIDFKQGDEFRSVYSPAAYLVDLLQLLDDEFDPNTIDFKERRDDIYNIDLDAENTTTLIPYLDIVNEILEGRVIKMLDENDTSDDAYTKLEDATYPFNMPFSLDNEKIKNHLHHLGISAHELRRLFATNTDYITVAREYLGLSEKEWAALVEPTATVTEELVTPYYGYTNSSFISDMSIVSTFMETTDLEAQEILELLYQNLYIDPSDHSIIEAGRETFYINTGTMGENGYVTLSNDETKLEWYSISDQSMTDIDIPIAWFERTSRFVRLAQKIGLSFTELDHILRHCCQDSTAIPTINDDTLVYIAQVVYIHKTLEKPIDNVVAILSQISYIGRTNNDLPQDQFNRIFNLPCVSIDEKYFHIDGKTGDVPEQYKDTTYNTYTHIKYYNDLFSDDNDTYRQRLRHALGFTETDLINITERLEFEGVADSSLWEDTANEWELLNVLYRIRALSDALDVHFLELFILFDLLEQDPFIGRYDPHTYFVYNAPSTQKCFEIFMDGYYQSTDSSASVYGKTNYGGTEYKLVPGKYNLSDLGNLSRIVSLKVPNGWSVTVYADENLNGEEKTYTEDTTNVGGYWNHRISSIVITGPTIDNRLWLFESLIALTKWMKEFGYSAEMLWTIANGAPMTDKAEEEQDAQDLALYNTLLQSFKAGEIGPNSLTEALGDERASHFAFNLIKERYGEMEPDKPRWACQRSHRKKHKKYKKHSAYKKYKMQDMHYKQMPMAPKERHNLLMAYKPREIQALTHEFIEQLVWVYDYEFVDLQLETKLEEKIFKNLVNHQVIDGSGKILLANLEDGKLPPLHEFMLEYDFIEIQQDVFDIFHRIYQEEATGKLEEGDTIEVQVFKSDFQELGLSAADVRELHDTLIYNGYIDEEGFARDVEFFGDESNARDLDLYTGLEELTDQVYRVLKVQLDKFAASKVKISEQMFTALELTPVALQDLLQNLQMNRYIDKQMFVIDKMRIAAETPQMMELALKFYPHREAICKALKDAIAVDKETWLQVDRAELGKISAKIVSHWVYADLEESFLNDNELNSEAIAFFKEESNRESFNLRSYFDASQSAIIFDHLAGIVNYADQYRLQDKKLTALDFDPEEIQALKQNLTAIGVLDYRGLLNAEQIPFFLIPENAASFSIPAFEDYNLEVFFLLYDVAQAIDSTVKAVDQALKDNSENQENGIVEQLQGVLGIDSDGVKALSKAIFKTEENLHFAWLRPLLEDANALGHLEELPENMHYTQAVKRIRQLALLIKQQQLDINEIDLALEDQDLVAKFPEDLILPDDSNGDPITSVDTLLETEEFIYIFKDDYYWIYLAEDYTLIDKKDIDLENEDDQDLIDLQKEDEGLQKRLKEDPIRQLFEEEENLSQVDAAFIDRHGTWVIVSGESHYVRYADSDAWDKRDNHFGQVDNDFENLEMIDAAYVDTEGRLFLFANDKYVRYSDLGSVGSPLSSDLKVDQGYPKSIAEDWNDENLPIQLPDSFYRDLGPMFDGVDDYSYAFLGDRYVSSEDGRVRPVAEKWGHREYNFGHPTHIDAALASQGSYFLFLENKVAKYTGSIELANLQPEDGYPKGIHQEFTGLPDEFVSGIDAALGSWNGTIYLFRDDEYVTIPITDGTPATEYEAQETRQMWGKVANDIANFGKVDAAFVGLDGYTYLFSGEQYVRYSGSDYSQVDDGFPRKITEDWEGLTTVTGAFVLGNKTYLFGTQTTETTTEDEVETTTTTENVYVRYSTLHRDEDDYLEVDEEDPNARVIETVLANRPDVEEIEVFPAIVNDDFWSLPYSVTNGDENFQIDAVMNGPEGKVYLFYRYLDEESDGVNYTYYYIEHDHINRWWSEPKVLSEQWDRQVNGLANERVVAAFMGKDGKTYLFYQEETSNDSKYLRFSDAELRNVDYGYPRLIRKFWGKVRNNIERTGKVDAAMIVESRWEEQDENGQLVDMTAEHTYLFSGDQFFRYLHEDSEYTYDTVEEGYPRSLSRLKDEPRFRGLQTTFPKGIDAAFADQRQVYLFKGDSFHVVIGDEDNYKQYDDETFTNVEAVAQEGGVNYLLITETESDNKIWYKVNHLEDQYITKEPQTPRTVQRAEDILNADGKVMTDVDAVLHGTNGKSYVFAGNKYYDVELEQSFTIADVWGRSRNPIYDQETIDAAFVGRDGVTYVFSGEWFVEYNTDTYTDSTVTYPPRRISDKWRGLNNVALAYVWREDTFLFERSDANGNFRYLHYTKDSYEKPGRLYQGDDSLWDIPTAYKREGFDLANGDIDAIFVHEDNLIFISDQHFISLNLNTQNWSAPQFLELLYPGIPFNKTDFKTLKSGFLGKDSKVYLFSQERYATYNNDNQWEIFDIKDYWGLQKNIFEDGVDAAWVNPTDRSTYLFAGDSYVRYSSREYRYVDEGYPKEIATYLRNEPAFAFMTKEFQQHLDEVEEEYATDPISFFDGLLDNGRCLYFFTADTVFTGSPNKYVIYEIDGLGQVENNFTQGGYVDSAFVVEAEDPESGEDLYVTYLFSGEQYIRYTVKQDIAHQYRGDYYRYIDEGYPKILGESFYAEEKDLLNLDLEDSQLPEDYRNGIDAGFYSSDLGLVLFNDQTYLHVAPNNNNTLGNINDVWGYLDNTFINESDLSIDGAYIDKEGGLLVFKGLQFVRYSNTAELFALNRYDEPRYVDEEFPRDITEIWPQLDTQSILTEVGVNTVFKFEDEIYFHTGENFVTYNLDMSDHDEEKPVKVLAYRWGEWSDYLLSDIHAISRFKDLNQRFTGGDLTLTELVSGANGEVKEPYMQLAAIFSFEKEEVRWVKQRNAFLANQVNVVEEDFQLELVLRLYDILATTQRLRVDVSAFYNDVWVPLYDPSAMVENQSDVATAATGAYDLLVSVDCNNNYETLVKQITNEVNTLKRDALVPYVIANDDDVNNTRQLYQKLLIDIQMDSIAETSRIKEAIAAVQLYIHRYFMNLEDIDLDASDQQEMRKVLKERWEWLQNYRVWEANRKVFLYPENYIRPELRDKDVKTSGFQALEESLSQGELTEDTVEEAYFKYLDSFTEVSELTIAGGYVYDDSSSGTDDKVLVLFGRTRTNPIRYFYRFGTFVDGNSSQAIWDPWEELDISIEAIHVEPVYAFNRVFVFWAVVEESSENPSSAIVTTSDQGDGNQTVSSSGNSYREIKVYYSFYNLNKRWSQPQTLQTTFNDVTTLKFSQYLAKVDLFVENSNKLTQNNTSHNYENIYISVRYYTSATYSSNTSTYYGPNYKAFNLTPELYSQSATPQSIENRGQELFKELFNEGDIEEENVVMLNYNAANSMDGPWFAYNHNGCGFLVKPDETSISGNTELQSLGGDSFFKNIPAGTTITAAVQVFEGGEVYFFLDNGTYLTVDSNGTVTQEAAAISSRWGIAQSTASAMQTSGNVDSAFVANGSSYLTLDDTIYEYTGSFSALAVGPQKLSEIIDSVPDDWTTVNAAFTHNNVTFWFNNATGTVLRSDTRETISLDQIFGLSVRLFSDLFAAIIVDNTLHLVTEESGTYTYTVYNADGSQTVQASATVKTLLNTIVGEYTISGSDADLAVMMKIDDGLWTIANDNTKTKRYAKKTGDEISSLEVPSVFEQIIEEVSPWAETIDYVAGFDYTHSNGTTYSLIFYNDSSGESNGSIVKTWSKSSGETNYGEGSGVSFSTGQSLYDTGVNVTAAFTTSDSIFIVTDSNTYHRFNLNQLPEDILDALKAGSNSGSLSDLILSDYLNTDKQHYRIDGVDAALIGTGKVGTTSGTLYLFCGTQYYRYSINNLAFTLESNYPKTLSNNNEGFPQWTTVDAAFTSSETDGSGNPVSYLFNNAAQEYYRSDTEETLTTLGVWGAVSFTTLQSQQRVDAAYVAGGSLYLIVGTEYYQYTLESGTIPTFIDSSSPQTYQAVFSLNEAISQAWRIPNLINNLNTWKAHSSILGGSYTILNNTIAYLEVEYQNLQNAETTDDVESVITKLTAVRDSLENSIGDVTSNYKSLYRSYLIDPQEELIKDLKYFITPQNLSNNIDAAFTIPSDDKSNYYVYLFSSTEYYRLDQNVSGSTNLGIPYSILGSWGNMPSDIRSGGLTSALNYTYTDSNTQTNQERLYLIKDSNYYAYDLDANSAKPYELDSVKYEVIRLTSSTAEQLNQILFAGGIKELLQMSTQEINESPTISTQNSSPSNIQMEEGKFNTEPINTHLDFNSANGIYYWEVFFHAPFLIAQTLNTDQQFEYAKEWYEYIFDPTEVMDYWKFLPFLAADPDALMGSLGGDLEAFETLILKEYDLLLSNTDEISSSNGNKLVAVAKTDNSNYHVIIFDSAGERVLDQNNVEFSDTTLVAQIEEALASELIDSQTKTDIIQGITSSLDQTPLQSAKDALSALAAQLAPYQAVFLGDKDITLYEEGFNDVDKLLNIEQWSTFTTMESEIIGLNTNAVSSSSDKALLATWQSEMQEVMEVIKKLEYRIGLMNNYSAQLAVYFSDPFDPHAIAALRPLAYRKAIVMRYIDNLLDWGDMLFRQYTRESINEARMLYILAYDILGEKPESIGRVVLENTTSYSGFAENEYYANSEDYDFLIELENRTTNDNIQYEQSLSFAALQFDTITNPYFYLKENELFTEYWTRVEDRLAKIRACLNIDGVAQPLPLFQPPIDPMALVGAVAGGASIAGAAAMAMGAASVPDYRFSSLMAKARDLVGKLKGLGDALLSALEKKDAEELSLLQNKQESVIHDMMTLIKEEQIKEAEVSLLNLEETKKSAEDQKSHYTDLINKGYLPEETNQIAMMTAAAAIHGLVVLSKIVSGLSYVVPQFTAGPFSFGVTSGGRNVGAMLGEFGESTESIAEGLSMAGEVAGVVAQFKRSEQDWKLQQKMATSEIEQIKHQIAAQKHSITVAKQELLVHQKEMENQEAIAKFMKGKFSNLELYNWMSGKISGLFYQTYKLAHDYAKQAEQAFIFEHGVKAGEVNYIGGMYWDSQKKGLLSGAQLELDLDRMEKAYMEMNTRSLEITKNISLLETDPMALLALKTKAVCTFRLSEELFDYDFPGHYKRQIKTISLAFDIGEGQSINATLTQLNHKLVMDTDIKAVKHLINPSNEPTTNVRANWRANQQVALSHVDQYTENNGMFELNFGDERYLPFEGTGAVSNWRLELNGMKGSYNPADLLDVTIKLRYTAKQGGSRFANEVKGVLKPYHATSFFDLAYNFPDQWEALTAGDIDEMEINFTRSMFPNMMSSKIIGLFMRYEYKGGSSGAIFTINDDLQVPNNTYLQPNTLSVGQNGTTWKFALKGDRSTLKNAEMILVYKAKV